MKRTATKIYNIADAATEPNGSFVVLFNYLDGGTSDEITLRENMAAFKEVGFRPRGVVAAPLAPDLSTTIFGADLALPVVFAPVGGLRLLYPDADRAAMRAAGSAGTAAILSTNSGTRLEDVAAAATGTPWFQLYFRGGREGAEIIVERAQKAGFKALFVTLDVAGGIQTERIRRDVSQLARLKGDIARDSSIPISMSVRNAVVFAPQLIRRLRWTAGYVRDGVPTHFVSQDEMDLNHSPEAKAADQKFPVWADLDWIRETWKGPLIAKGLSTGDDARRALDHGVDGIVVSNHGGRQLDGSPATLRCLPEVRRAVGDSVTVLLDGGVRRGGDVVKAIAMGANAAMIGRVYAYGLAAAGEAGAKRVLDIIQLEMSVTMKNLGLSSISEIDESSVDTSKLFLAQRLAAQEAR